MKAPKGRGHQRGTQGSPAKHVIGLKPRNTDLELDLFRQLAETLPELLWTCLPDGKCDYFNAQWTRFTGKQQSELLGDQWRDCMHPEDREATCSYWLAALKGEVPYNLEYRLRHHQGQFHWFKVRAAPLRDADGKIIKWFGVSTDIHDLKETENNLRASDAWLRMLLEATKDFAIFSLDLQGNVTEWNAGAENIFGYEARELIGHTGEILFLPEDREAGVPAKELQAARTDGVAMDERWHVRKDGQKLFAGGAVRPLYDERAHLKGYLKIARDMTSRKEMEQRLESQVGERTARLREMMREMEAFSYSVSHDLRAPLRAINGFTHFLIVRAGSQLSPELNNVLNRIVASTRQAEALIRDVLDYSKVGRAEMPLTSIDLEALLKDIVSNHPAFEAAQSQIHIRSPLPHVLGNRPSLERSIINLLSNAVKFVPREITPDIHVWAEPNAHRARLWIEDNGIGIGKDELERIFTPFQRSTLAIGFEGTGVGLAIVRKAIERMNGSVGVISTPGEGSRFWLELPLAKPAAVNTPVSHARAE